jgi:hypothetical protein
VSLPIRSLAELIHDLEKNTEETRGVISIRLRACGSGRYSIAGFMQPGDLFMLCGLLDWVKADLLQGLGEANRE